ncbi:hypothetical protein Lalb_Chr24g0394511 [Lupinus albus]|uniref:Uncharacterized protein n=1 Tax=Lupinus albus TaxID=3870 RepID=A0A6A4N676_LUPAL|nr:hypothetical protein Lalb_Chr24g0394511 [Lupinus albus]
MLQTMRRQYELMQMEEGERISEFFTRIITQTNAMKACGEKTEDATIVEKILRAVAPKFDHVVVAIEESGKLDKMKVVDLQGSVEAHEQRLNKRGVERSSHQALHVQTPLAGEGAGALDLIEEPCHVEQALCSLHKYLASCLHTSCLFKQNTHLLHNQ